jgi:hypothetical protein
MDARLYVVGRAGGVQIPAPAASGANLAVVPIEGNPNTPLGNAGSEPSSTLRRPSPVNRSLAAGTTPSTSASSFRVAFLRHPVPSRPGCGRAANLRSRAELGTSLQSSGGSRGLNLSSPPFCRRASRLSGPRGSDWFGPWRAAMSGRSLTGREGLFHPVRSRSLRMVSIRMRLDQEDDIGDGYLGVPSSTPAE